MMTTGDLIRDWRKREEIVLWKLSTLLKIGYIF